MENWSNTMAKFEVIDDNGTIEDGDDIQQLIEDEDRIREENPDIKGELKFIEIHHVSN
ncbi:hypothetical protein LCGC14_2456580 [marine sediment metagenome]|uniref:Uncharacterized protein n=1 Tax=marine sediment metagenome TaxID=412755 RepID=A0A0F9BEG1_9ZZZZ